MPRGGLLAALVPGRVALAVEDADRGRAIGDLERIEAFTSNLYDWGTHWFDMMFFYNDETPVEWVIGQIDARGGYPLFGAMLEGQGLSLFKWQNGVSGLMVTGQRELYQQGEPLKSIDCANRLIGSDGVIEVGVQDGPTLRLRNRGTGGAWQDIDVDGGLHGSDFHVAAVLDLVDALKTGREPELAGRRALQATELIFATYESSRRRGRIDLPLDIDDSPYMAMLNRADMTTWPAFDVVANGIRINCYRTGGRSGGRSGGNKPPLVLSHGFSDNGMCWPILARALEQDYDVIMYDARGHGLSDAPDEGYTYKDHAADLVGLIQALGLEKPAALGHSMGASTVAAAAAMYPGVIGRAILEDPPWREPIESEDRGNMVEEWRARIVERKRMSREAVMDQCREEHPTWDEPVLGPWAEANRQLSLKVFSDLGGLSGPWQETAAQISCPTLLITADPDQGGIVTPEVAAEAAELNDQVKIVHIEGAGHSIRREAFEPYVQAVREFLAGA